MADITVLDDVVVETVRVAASDSDVLFAARVSTIGKTTENGIVPPNLEQTAKDAGLINYLMKSRHGSPFEHNSFTFYIEADIAVAREAFRHRIASYNEMSGRYKELPARFYIPNKDRPLVQTGSSAHPSFGSGTIEQYEKLSAVLLDAYTTAFEAYETLLKSGIAKEVARLVLPVGMNTQWYVTMNARSLMNFLSLRTKDDEAMFPSNPMHEIELVAKKMEAVFAEAMPMTYASWVKNGKVAP